MTSSDNSTAIAALDLDPIKVKLMHQPSGEGWSLSHVTAVEAEYRRFLILMKQYPQEPVAPSNDVDTFWHYHILDTMKYATDCDAVFGHFLHHFPYMGLRGEDDEHAHEQAGTRMQELYRATFGTAPVCLSDDPASKFARDPNGAAFSITPPDQQRYRDPEGAAFSITPPDRDRPRRNANGIAFSITPPDHDGPMLATARFTLQRPSLSAA